MFCAKKKKKKLFKNFIKFRVEKNINKEKWNITFDEVTKKIIFEKNEKKIQMASIIIDVKLFGFYAIICNNLTNSF